MSERSHSSVGALLSAWRSDLSVAGNLVAWETFPAKAAQTEEIPPEVSPPLRSALTSLGIETLYSHQAGAYRLARQGRHVVVATGTASGKTLCYNLPVIDHLLRSWQGRALYLFPTKALAQDQKNNLIGYIDAIPPRELAGYPPGKVTVGIYDGDTPTDLRSAIRSKAQIILTNPDMLHTGILPHHTIWADFLRNLRFVVIDEMHIYRGVFGSHVANVIRRLKRLAKHYGANPQFIMTSATIANPIELSGRLIEEPVSLIDTDGSARGARHFMIYNPPVVDKELGLRRSSMLESVRLADQILGRDIQTIVFGRSRRTVELVLSYLRQKRPGETNQIRGYRSGYLSPERRAIEQGLRQGTVSAVVATNALELGIDIGGMGAALMVGYPGTIAATWQQAGRAGRKTDASVAVLITSADALDQFLAHHPDYFFSRSVEQALINPDNLLILLQHIQCAAFELPFQEGDGFGKVPPETVGEYLRYLEESNVLHTSGGRFFWMADQYPANNVSLRSASPEEVLLQAEVNGITSTIGSVDLESAPRMVHPGAVYLHEGQVYRVEELRLEEKIARLKSVDVDYYTEPRVETTVQRLNVTSQAETRGCTKSFGEIQVTNQLIGYRKIRWFTHEHLGHGEAVLPPTTLQTTGYWLTLTDETVQRLQDQGLWTGESNDYGPGWPALRNQIRARDGYRCQVCGALEIDRTHHVHHKTPFRTFTSLEAANNPDNLITLCPMCHRKVEMNVKMRSGLAGLAYTLGQLAPLFLMCDRGDLGVHSDPESPLGDGKPTIVLYDMVPAGIGLSERLFDLHEELIRRASELVSQCECVDGCPSCIGPAGENGAGGKPEALALLAELVNEIKLDGNGHLI